ncbi:MAG: trehalose utilization protein ThuA [Chloroflexi bacterium]|nr:MAG: trehalose utilization protein ThuA [Chloroflexota bacterium]TMF25611.1 MAG: trehalose utilization protein ThuA [Chloroflexota bacterium]TMF98603.1 MAG: trehalose utilization protein ThuA [Chloroflexota bacterium]
MAERRHLNVTVWNEHVHERREPSVSKIYPDGMHAPIVEGLRRELAGAVTVRVATLDEPEHGLTSALLADTDVLTWWGHAAHDQVADEVVERVFSRVLDGMGIVVLHSGHHSKIFKRLMGTSCSLIWRSDPGGERELIWTVSPAHPIAAGVPQPIVVPHQEMYGEFFDIPPPDELVFVSSFEGGEVFRGGCCYFRGAGRVFYFGPGDQEYPVYHQPEIQRVIANAVAWCGGVSQPNDLPSARQGNRQRNWWSEGS